MGILFPVGRINSRSLCLPESLRRTSPPMAQEPLALQNKKTANGLINRQLFPHRQPKSATVATLAIIAKIFLAARALARASLKSSALSEFSPNLPPYSLSLSTLIFLEPLMSSPMQQASIHNGQAQHFPCPYPHGIN